MTYDNLDGFLGHEIWYGEEDRIVGLIAADAVDDMDIYGQSVNIQLISSGNNTYDVKSENNLELNSDGTYSYGGIGIKIHDTNYIRASIDTDARVMNTTINSASGKDAVELVLSDKENGLYSVKSGERKYALVEIYNREETVPLEDVSFSDNDGVLVLNVSGKDIVYNLSEKTVLKDGKEYPHGSGGFLSGYSVLNEDNMHKDLFGKDFEENVYTPGDKGYYTGDKNDNSANNVLFYDSGCDSTQNASSHFEICGGDAGKYVKFKVEAMSPEETGTVKSYFLQFSNLQEWVPCEKMMYQDTQSTAEHFNIEFDLKCPKESYDTSLRFEIYQNTSANLKGASTSVTFNCGTDENGEGWVHHKLIFDKRARKAYLYRDNLYSGEFSLSASSDLFRNGINLIRIYFRGTQANGNFAKDMQEREVSLDNFKITVPSITYKTVSVDNNEGVCAEAEVLNNTFEKHGARLICAVYEGARLIEVKTSEAVIINPLASEVLKLEYTPQKDISECDVKLFLWDSDITPLEKVIY